MISTALGQEPSFRDWFFPFWTWGCFLVPLAVLQLYFIAQDRGGPAMRLATGPGLIVLTLTMAAGTIAFGVFSQRLISGEAIGF